MVGSEKNQGQRARSVLWGEQAIPQAELSAQMQQASVPSLDFVLMLTLAALIATFGLIADSAPTIIGAMIVAPLMSPIISLSFALSTGGFKLMAQSALSVTLGALLVVAIGYATSVLFGLRIAGSEILSRTAPSLIDLAVAMASGAAAAFAHSRRSIVASIAGVAIAVALVPPLAVSGIGLGLGQKGATEMGLHLGEIGFRGGGADVAYGAALLFLTNLVGIVSIATLVFILCGYGRRLQSLIGLTAFLFAAIVIFQPLQEAFREIYVKNRAVRLLVKLQDVAPEVFTGDGKLRRVSVDYREQVLHVHFDLFLPQESIIELPARVDMVKEALSKDIGEPVALTVEAIPVDIITVETRPTSNSSEK